MLRFNTFRARRYSRSRFVEGAFFLASEATDLQLEILDQLRETVRRAVGDIAVGDAWKVEKLSDTQLLVRPGEAWADGVPIVMRFGGDHLVSGSSLIPGDVPAGTVITDDVSGSGKIITFNSGGTTPSDTYRIVIAAREEAIDNTDDPFIKNANLSESTGQKLRLQYRIDIVPESAQTETPVPYTNDIGDQNLVNKVTVTPAAAGNGELISTNLLSGAEEIDGRDLELVLRNDPGIGSGNPIPNGVNDQAAFENGTLIDSVGNEYHINVIFNDTISTQVVIRIDKEVDQPNPQIINGSPFTLKKRPVFVTDNVNGNPQGKLFFPIATAVWDSTDGFVSEESITDLRNSVEKTEDFQSRTNQKFNLHVVGGGNVAFASTSGASKVSWSSDLKILNPGGPVMTISASDAVMLDGGALVYELDLEAGGALERGQLAVNITAAGSTVTLDPISLSNVRIGNVLEDSGGDVAYVTDIDDVNNQLTLNTAVSNTGAATIYLDSFGPSQAKIGMDSYCIATADGGKIYFANQLELELGETSQIGDGISEQLLNFIAADSETNDSPPLRLVAHESDLDKARIVASDLTLLNASIVSQELSNLIVSFDGAVIDFTTGDVFESDGVTPLGINFSPFAIPVGEYFWYGVSLVAGATTADNRINLQVQVDLASGSDAAAGSAPFPAITGSKKLGAVQVQNNGGSIERTAIRILGTGASGGGGTGTGDANAKVSAIDIHLANSIFQLANANVFAAEEDTQIDGSSTGSYSNSNQTFEMDSAETMVSTNNLDSEEFLDEGKDVSEIQLLAFWDEAAVDDAATYEVSRDGGNEYQTVTMERVGDDTDTFVGTHQFEEEAANQTLQSNDLTSDDTTSILDDGTAREAHAQTFTVTNSQVVKEVALEVNKLGSPTGSFTIKIVDDSGGDPDLSSEQARSTVQFIDDLSAGVNSVAVAMQVPLPAGDYHIVLETDATYKASYSTGVDEIGVRTESGGTPDSRIFDGSTWSASTDGQWVYEVNGRELDLRVRITAGTNSVVLEGYGLLYDKVGLAPVTGVKDQHQVLFDGIADNFSTFTLPFLPDSSCLVVYELETGQAYRFGAFQIDGYDVIFPTDTFNKVGTITLDFIQSRGVGTADTSLQNAGNIASLSEPGSLGSPKLATVISEGAVLLNKAQRKDLSVTVSTDATDVSDLQFNNLEVGKWYRVSGLMSLVIDSADVNAAIHLYSASAGGGTFYGKVQGISGGSNSAPAPNFSIEFEAVSSSLYFRTSSFSGTTSLNASGGADITFAVLTELNNVETTTDFT